MFKKFIWVVNLFFVIIYCLINNHYCYLINIIYIISLQYFWCTFDLCKIFYKKNFFQRNGVHVLIKYTVLSTNVLIIILLISSSFIFFLYLLFTRKMLVSKSVNTLHMYSNHNILVIIDILYYSNYKIFNFSPKLFKQFIKPLY